MFKNLKIGKKLLTGFIAVALLASIAGIVSIFAIQNTNEEYSRALVSYGFSQGDIGKAMLMVSNNNTCVRDIIGMPDESLIQSAKDKMEVNTKKYDTYVAAVEKTLTAPEEDAQFKKIQDAQAAYLAKRDEVAALGDTTDTDKILQAQRMAAKELDPLFDKFYDAWAGLMKMNVDTGNKISSDLSAQGNISLIFNLVLTVVSFIISIILGILISRGISRPINRCVDRLVLLEQGDLKTEVPESTSRDETGILLDALKGTVDRLQAIIGDTSVLLSEMAKGNFDVHSQAADKYVGEFQSFRSSMRKLSVDMSGTLAQIDESSNQVAAGSDQVSSGAQALSQGATEQASSVEELAATINEISGQVQETSQNADEAKLKTEDTGSEVITCNQQMQELIAAMEEISVNSNEIGKIIKTIEDIAFQTNILALNAAVEAARAGVAGKGFAVVADEVRNLASKSAEASKNTSALIENAVSSVSRGTKIAENTAETLDKVVKSTTAVMDIVDKITGAAKHQADSIVQVTTGVDQISSVVQTNSATAEESAAASEELSGQAQMLKNLLSRFKLRHGA